MPDTTPVYGWPVPVLTDDPNIPADVTALALAIETTVSSVVVPGVTQLPASATDGDMVDLIVTGPFGNTIFWRFRYAAGEPAFPWMFIGGPPLFNKRDPTGHISPGGANDWQTLAGTETAGPAVTLPVHAYYDVRFGATIASATNGQVAQVGVSQSGSDPGGDNTASTGNLNTASVVGAWFPFDTDYPAATVLRLMYRCSGTGGTADYSRRWLSVLPMKATA